MSDFIISVAQYLAPSAVSQIGYLLEYKSNFEKVKTEVQNLKRKRTGIQHQVDAAKNKVEEIEEDVEKWLKRAKVIEENAQKWLESAIKIIPNEDTAAAGRTGENEEETAGNARQDEQTAAMNGWLNGLSPAVWKKRYELGKEAVMQREAVVEHLEAGKFDQISHPVIPEDPRLCTKDFETFESRASTFTNVISSLSDPDVNIVGICGMGGIGKTTLATQVANHLQTNKVKVVFAEISQNQDIMKIQNEIGGQLGLLFSQEETQPTRAGKLCQRLKNEKSILIILDNIWERLDLRAVGIPHKDEHRGCKLLLTARHVDVLSSKMDSQSNFKVGDLHHDEAWNFFKKMTGEYIEDCEFKSLATKLVNKCACLPLAVVTVARALRNKPSYRWEDAWQRWQQMGTSSSGVVKGIYESIQLSYDLLEDEELRQTLLLIRYANLTSTDELLTYGLALGLFEGIDKMETRRVRVQTLVQQLKDSCLLLNGNTTGEHFSMHDVVRDVILQIASKERHAFTNERVAELEWPDETTLKAYHSIVLEHVETGELPPVLECQQLKLLSISGADSYSEVQNNFFGSMTKLKVLVLADMDLSSVPQSICFLSNLQALSLHYCKLDGVAILGELKKLEILSLRNSEIERVSAELARLTRLKSLDLRSTNVRFIPPNVISRLCNLEELYMDEFEWEKEGLDEARENASLSELKHLSKLTCLELQIHDANTLPRELSFRTLERYKIAIKGQNDTFWDNDKDWMWSFTTSNSCRKFKLSLTKTNICLNYGHIMQLKGIQDLCLGGAQNMKSVLFDLDRGGFPQLKYLQVQDNDNLLYIVDSMKCLTPNVFPILESLLLRNLVNLEKICGHQLTVESSFSQLRKIKMKKCYRLENIFLFSIARRLRLLESIDVIDCENMKCVFGTERGYESNNKSELTDNIKFSKLRSLKLKFLPKFRSFYSKLKIPSTSDEITLEENVNFSNILFIEEVAVPNLEILELHKINVQMIWQKQVATESSVVKNLTRLTIVDCGNLTCLFSSSIAGNFFQLQHLDIVRCQALEKIFVIDEGDCIGFPSLKALSIHDCPELMQFIGRNTSTNHLKEIPLSFFNEKVALPNLESFGLSYCNSLKCLFSSSVAKSLARLRDLRIWDCLALEVIFDMEGVSSADKGSAVVSRLSELSIYDLPKLRHVWNADPQGLVSFQNLKMMRINRCDGLKSIFPVSIASSLLQLQSLDIRNCGVEEIVSVADHKRVETINRFVFPRVYSLDLENLPNLTTFSSGMCTVEWPAIKGLLVSDSETMMNFLKSNREGQPQILIEKVLPNLEGLLLKEKGIAKISQFPEDLICNIKYLDVRFDEPTVISSLDFLQRFHNMKMLTILGEHYGYGRVDDWVHPLIKNLLPSSTSFGNLTTLSVSFCQRFTSIVASSTAKSLVQLKTMAVGSCHMLTEVVGADEGDNEAKGYEIVFIQLKELRLSNLESLTSFCSANYVLKFPSLEELVVENCPKMKRFSGVGLSTPKLQKVMYKPMTTELRNGDLNTTIQEWHKGKLKNIDDDDKAVETENVAGSSNSHVS